MGVGVGGRERGGGGKAEYLFLCNPLFFGLPLCQSS